MENRLERLNRYLRRMDDLTASAKPPSIYNTLDQWIRAAQTQSMRLKEWKRSRTVGYSRLRSLGIADEEARKLAGSEKDTGGKAPHRK